MSDSTVAYVGRCRYTLSDPTRTSSGGNVTCNLLRGVCCGLREKSDDRGKGSDHGHNHVSEKNDGDDIPLLLPLDTC